jgi:multiple sugar transport system permease protein
MRSLLLLPLMLPPVISGMMWKTMLASSSGPVNYLFGLGSYAWFANPWSARFVVIFIEIWSSTPFVALVLLSGLQSLPKEPFEAAQVDGAKFWFILRRLMLPMLQPFTLIVLLFRVVDVVKLFDIVFATTSGGPMFTTTTIPILVYKEVFKSYTLGSAISKVLILWIINYAISFWLAGRWRKSSASIR